MQTKPMTLERLEIRKTETYRGEPPDGYIAEIEYQGSRGKITVPLSVEVSMKLLEFVGPVLAEMAKRSADEIASNIFRAVEDTKHPAITETSS